MTDQLAFRDRDFEFSVYLTTAAGVAIDITASTWTLTLRRNNVETVLATTTPAIGSAAGGRLDVSIAAAVMTFDGGRLVAELTRTDTGADTYARWYVSYGNPGQVVGGSGDITIRNAANITLRAVNAPAGPAGSGGGGVITGLTATAWRVFYSSGAGAVAELALGADGTFLKSNGAAAIPSFATPSGSGDVAKVGTPVDNQIGVWTGSGTLEGDTALTFDTTSDTLVIAASGNLAFGAVTILDDAAGTMTLQNIDALDATTEATIEAAIDTLANLASVNGFSFSVSANAVVSGTNTGDQSAASILAALITVDGAASGLDADLLDGLSSAAFQPVDADLTTIAALTATTDSFIQSKASAWAARTIAQVKTDLGLTGTNSGDQTISDATLSTSDITTNNFTTAKHGFVPKGTNVGSFLKDDGTWAAIPGGGDALVANTLAQFAATTSLQLKNTISDEQGSGSLVFATSPTLVTPVLGVATATSINGATITSGTLNGSVTGANTGDQTITLTGDVTGTGTGSFVTTIAAGVVTLADMVNMATSSLIYRKTAGTGVPEVNTLATLKTDLVLVKGDVGLGNVDNTSDANKPVSSAQQTALNLKANLAGPTFTGVPAAPTAAVATNTTQLATTAFVIANAGGGGGVSLGKVLARDLFFS